jgi:hypothetical protein
MAEKFEEVLNGNDIDALKTALQNLMVLFETQNRNYMELREHLKAVKLQKPNLSMQKLDTISISGEQAASKSEGIVEDAFELLAAVRLARKSHAQASSEIEHTLRHVIGQEKANQSRITHILDRTLS